MIMNIRLNLPQTYFTYNSLFERDWLLGRYDPVY